MGNILYILTTCVYIKFHSLPMIYPRGHNLEKLPSIYLFSKPLNWLDYDPSSPKNPKTLGDCIRKHKKEKGFLIRPHAYTPFARALPGIGTTFIPETGSRVLLLRSRPPLLLFYLAVVRPKYYCWPQGIFSRTLWG